MKWLLVFCFIAVVIVMADSGSLYPRGCRYIMGMCVEECPEGTHGYAVGCDYITPEPTCQEPNPVLSEYMICDYSSCYCDPPTVRDTTTNKCVLYEECSKQ